LTATRIFFSTDIHGSETCFLKFVRAADYYKADALVLGGDITGKAVVPLIEMKDGGVSATFLGRDYVARTSEETEKLKKLARDVGYYVFMTDSDRWAEINSDRSKMSELFIKLASERVRQWAEISGQKLRERKLKIYVTGGNDDPFEIDDVIKASESFVYCHDQLVDLLGHEMISTGYANMTPWELPRDISEEELARIIEELAVRVKDMKNAIFNFHAPPHSSKLDEAPKLSREMQAQPDFIPVGSTAVRSAIEKYQPLLGLHGHIHESRGAIKIGDTLCVNPGSEYGEGILRGAIINLELRKIKGYLLTSG
jgi:Icc-related predicted phosphoesterase